MKTRSILILFFLLFTSGLRVAAAPTVVPVYKEPRHRLVYEKGDIRIINVSIPAGDTSLYHHHQNPTLFVMLSGALMRNQNLGGKWTDPSPDMVTKVGAFVFMDYPKPQDHRVQNIDHQSFQAIGVINAGPGSGSTATLAQKPEVDNRWFNGYRFKLAPGAETGIHHHAFPVFIVQVGKGDSVVIERGYPTAEKTVSGNWSVHAAGVDHRLRNIGTTEVELVEIEMK